MIGHSLVLHRDDPGRFRSWIARAVILALIVTAAIGLQSTSVEAASKSGHNGVKLTVNSTTIKNKKGEVMVRVKGSGFSVTANNKFGVYLSFGEKPKKPNKNDAWGVDTLRYYNKGAGRGTLWIHPGTPSGANQAKLKPNGTFNVLLAVKAKFKAPNGVTYPRSKQRPLGILVYAAHGTQTARNAQGKRTGYSQYAFLKLNFKAGTQTTALAPEFPAVPADITTRTASPVLAARSRRREDARRACVGQRRPASARSRISRHARFTRSTSNRG